MLHHSYTIAKKLAILDLLHQNTVKEVLALFPAINASMLSKWRRREDEFRCLTKKTTSRKVGSGRTSILGQEAELQLSQWIRDERGKGVMVDYTKVRKYCMSAFPDVQCLYSTGWFAKFRKRNSFSRRRITSHITRPSLSTQQDPNGNLAKVLKVLGRCCRIGRVCCWQTWMRPLCTLTCPQGTPLLRQASNMWL